MATRHSIVQQKTASLRAGMRRDLVQPSLFTGMDGQFVVDTHELAVMVDEPDASSDEWYTPQWLLDWLGRIGHDPCWCEHSLVKADTRWDIRQGENALGRQWPGVRVFCNPPYSKKSVFVAYMHGQAKGGAIRTSGAICALIPSDAGETFWHDYVWGKDACVGFLRGRVAFVTANRAKRGGGLGGSALVLWGADRLAWQAEIAERAARSEARSRVPHWAQVR